MLPRLLALVVAVLGLPQEADVVARYDALALQGDLTGAQRLFASAPESAVGELRDRFEARFVERTEAFPSTGDELVDDVLAEYRTYWADSLLSGRAAERGRPGLVRALRAVLKAHELPVQSDALKAVGAELERRGFHSIMGVTAPLQELMLWRGEERREYTVELTDSEQTVTVVFLSDFVSMGWAHFATFGRSSTGGWATREALFCLRESYDLDSERFRVSYLQHEGRHFADYSKYPVLESADLEYRAKLTELAFARETSLQLLRNFSLNASPDSDAPHTVANHAVALNLSRAVFDSQAPVPPERWSTLDPAELREAARWLLEEHDRALEARGARTTRGVLAR